MGHPAKIILGVSVAALLFGVATRPQSIAAASAISASPTTQAASIPAGVIITHKNADQYAAFISPPLRTAIERGLVVKVAPTERIDWNRGFQHATENYSPQVKLDDNDNLLNYTAGLPFPFIEPNDPKVALKIAYNVEFGPFVHDDHKIIGYKELAYSQTGSDPTQLTRQPDYDHTADEVDYLRFAHRTEVSPTPTFGSDPLGVEFKIRVHGWNDPSHTTCAPYYDRDQNIQAIYVRVLDPKSGDEQTATAVHQRKPVTEGGIESFGGEGFCADLYIVGKAQFSRYRLVAVQPTLACIGAQTDRAGVAADNAHLDQVTCELRQAYVLEATLRDPKFAQLHTVFYVDAETYLPLADDNYVDRDWDVRHLSLWHRINTGSGGSKFEIVGKMSAPNWDYLNLVAPDTRKYPPGLFWWFEPDRQEINSGQVSESNFVKGSLQW